jgi:hypothetical protein
MRRIISYSLLSAVKSTVIVSQKQGHHTMCAKTMPMEENDRMN